MTCLETDGSMDLMVLEVHFVQTETQEAQSMMEIELQNFDFDPLEEKLFIDFLDVKHMLLWI